MGTKILETVRSFGMRLRGWLPWPWKKPKPNEWFWVVADDRMDEEKVISFTAYNIRTGEEIDFFYASGEAALKAIPRELRMSYSEYVRIDSERRRIARSKDRQQAPASPGIDTSAESDTPHSSDSATLPPTP